MKQVDFKIALPGSDTMASTSSDIASLKAENARLRAELRETYELMESWRRDAHELDEMVKTLRERIRGLLKLVPEGALPRPTVFGTPRNTSGSEGAAVAVYGNDGTIPAITRRDEHGNLQVMLCATPSGASGLVVEAAGDGRARWVSGSEDLGGRG